MPRLFARIGVPVGLAIIVAALSAAAVDAKGPNHHKSGDVPIVFWCIDFNADSCTDLDGDGWIGQVEINVGSDPHDIGSTPESGLLDEQFGINTCHDGIDNDKDGRTDQQDPGCRLKCGHYAGQGQCADPDHDGFKNYVEALYGSSPKDHTSTPENLILDQVSGSHTCSDGIDNDADGSTDSADSGCGGSPGCIDFPDTPDCPPSSRR